MSSPKAEPASRRALATASCSSPPAADDPHAAPTASGACLDQHRPADPVCGRPEIEPLGDLDAVEHGHPGLAHQLLGPQLGPHRGDRVGRWPDPDEPRVLHGAGEVGVLRQEPVAGVDRVGAGPSRRVHEQVGAQVGVGRRGTRQPHREVGLRDERGVRVGVGVHCDDGEAHLAGGPRDPAGDLPPVGDEQRADHRHGHIRKTPKPRRPRTSFECTAVSARPRTVRVSRGSMIPSS